MEDNKEKTSEVFLFSNELNSHDLYLIKCGRRKQYAGNHGDPVSKNEHFQIYYILKGEGNFVIDNKRHKVLNDQCLVIFPNEACNIQSIVSETIEYDMLGFQGLKAEYYLQLAGVTRENRILTFRRGVKLKEYIDDIIHEASGATVKKHFHIQYMLYSILNEIIENYSEDDKAEIPESIQEDYVIRAIQYIILNYSSHDLNISEIAKHLKLNQCYLSDIFKHKIGISPIKYLIKYRMDKAGDLLKNNNYSIGDIANCVGYPDQMNFSKVFKKIKGFTPKEYRKIEKDKRNEKSGSPD